MQVMRQMPASFPVPADSPALFIMLFYSTLLLISFLIWVAFNRKPLNIQALHL